jgi:hypothetical protein
VASERADFVSAIAIIAGSAILIFHVIPSQTIKGFPGEFPQTFMPILASAIMFIASTALAARSLIAWRLRRRNGQIGRDAEGSARDAWITAIGLSAAFVVVLAVLSRFGFLLGGAFAIMTFGLLFNHRRPVSIVLLAIALPPVAHFLAINGLGLSLP